MIKHWDWSIFLPWESPVITHGEPLKYLRHIIAVSAYVESLDASYLHNTFLPRSPQNRVAVTPTVTTSKQDKLSSASLLSA